MLLSPFVVDADTFPQTLALLRNRAEAVGIELVVLDLAATPGDAPELADAFGLFVQYPGASGRVWNPEAVIAAAKAAGAVVVAAADLLALTLLRSPGEKRKAWSDLLFAQDVLARGHG